MKQVTTEDLRKMGQVLRVFGWRPNGVPNEEYPDHEDWRYLEKFVVKGDVDQTVQNIYRAGWFNRAEFDLSYREIRGAMIAVGLAESNKNENEQI